MVTVRVSTDYSGYRLAPFVLLNSLQANIELTDNWMWSWREREELLGWCSSVLSAVLRLDKISGNVCTCQVTRAVP